MKTIVSKDLCISCGLCADIAPGVYMMDDDDKAVVVKKSELNDREEAAAREAASSCPSDAISNS